MLIMGVVIDTIIITLLLILLSFHVIVFWVSVWALFLELKYFWSLTLTLHYPIIYCLDS